MISLSSIINFFKMNTIMVIMGSIQYWLTLQFLNYRYGFLLLVFMYWIKNYLLVKLIDYGTQKKKDIKPDKIIKESYKYEFMVDMTIAAFIEAVTVTLSTSLIPFKHFNSHDLLTFIPLSFLFEVIFDFFHYWTHRLGHVKNTPFYYFHRKHHQYHYTSSITTFHHHPIDLIITNSVPYLITSSLVPMTFYQMNIFIIYKTFIEISGHSGKKLKPISSFPQFMWLPKYMGIELYSEDHGIHHSHYIYNYSKRFSLWDKVFGTYLGLLPSPIYNMVDYEKKLN